MVVSAPDNRIDLLERPIVATLVTMMPDNTPQATPVWFNWDGSHLWINTAKGRRKYKNMLQRPHVSMVIIDPEDPYRWLEIRGEVVESTELGGVDHINALAKRYVGREDYYAPMPERKRTETRVIFKIRPKRFVY